jgi:HemY protein
MINLLLLIVAVTSFGLVAAWLAENPGSVTMYWFDYRIDTSVAGLCVVALLFAFTLIAIISFVRMFVAAPRRFVERKSIRQYKKGLSELTYSVAALAASDWENAEKRTKKAQKLLGDIPLTLLLSAQVARHKQDNAKAKESLEQMLEHPETEYLAARLLSDAAGKNSQYKQALALAERAKSANKKGRFAALQIINVHLQQGDWQEALHAINQSYKDSALKRNERAHARALVFYKQAKKLIAEDKKEAAIYAINELIKTGTKHPAMVDFAARQLKEAGQFNHALSLLQSVWKSNPHPTIAETYRDLIRDLPEPKQKKLLHKIASIHELPPVGFIQEWSCNACHHLVNHWDVHCPHCGTLDSLVPKVA